LQKARENDNVISGILLMDSPDDAPKAEAREIIAFYIGAHLTSASANLFSRPIQPEEEAILMIEKSAFEQMRKEKDEWREKKLSAVRYDLREEIKRLTRERDAELEYSRKVTKEIDELRAKLSGKTFDDEVLALQEKLSRAEAENRRLGQMVEQEFGREDSVAVLRERASENFNTALKAAEALELEQKRSQRLVEALKYYADEKNWYGTRRDFSDSRRGQRMVIGSLDTEGDNWLGGYTARRALANHAQESAGGEGV
jgi:hypothetical protein